MDVVYPPVIAVARGVFAAQGIRFDIRGTENVPRSGGAVMAINHTGYLDFTYAGLAALPSKRLVRFMAKEAVFRHKISGPLMRGMHHIPVDRAAGMAAFRDAVTALKAGEIVGVFPEATISMSFELKEFKSGTIRMAQLAGVPILPTTIWGSQRVWTKGQPKRLGRHNVPIYVTVGEPIVVARGEDSEAANRRLRDAMQAQLDEQQGRYPPFPASQQHLLPVRLGGTAPTPEAAAEMEAARHRREAQAREAADRA